MPPLCSYSLLTHEWQHKEGKAVLALAWSNVQNSSVWDVVLHTAVYGAPHAGLFFPVSLPLLPLCVTHVFSLFSSHFRTSAESQTQEYYCCLSRMKKADWVSANRAILNLDQSDPLSFTLHDVEDFGEPLKQTPAFPVDQHSWQADICKNKGMLWCNSHFVLMIQSPSTTNVTDRLNAGTLFWDVLNPIYSPGGKR